MPGWVGQIANAVGVDLFGDWWLQVIVAVVLAALAFLLKPVRQGAAWLWRRIREAWGAQSRIEYALRALDSEGVFLSKPIKRPPNYELSLQASIPVLTIANLKGGVGKTTLAANLGAHFALVHGERVLLIDLDFQGSLSSRVAPNASRPVPGVPSRAAKWMNDAIDPASAIQTVIPVDGIPTLRLLPAYYDLAQAENRKLFRWLLRQDKEDLRYGLARILHSEEFRRSFDRIIIDAPPRLSPAMMQALCVSTEILVPTVLDQMSGEAVGTFIEQVSLHKAKQVCPGIRKIFVVGTMTRYDIGARAANGHSVDSSLSVVERQGLAEIKVALDRARIALNQGTPLAKVLEPTVYIQQLDEIALARNSYAQGPAARAMFANLANALMSE